MGMEHIWMCKATLQLYFRVCHSLYARKILERFKQLVRGFTAQLWRENVMSITIMCFCWIFTNSCFCFTHSSNITACYCRPCFHISLKVTKIASKAGPACCALSFSRCVRRPCQHWSMKSLAPQSPSNRRQGQPLPGFPDGKQWWLHLRFFFASLSVFLC